LESLHSLRTMILENQVCHHGASNSAQKWIDGEFRELFFPQEEKWKIKAAADGRQAFEGILKTEGYLAEKKN
jgi:hypothetical protein